MAVRRLTVLVSVLALVWAHASVATACRLPGRGPVADRTIDIYAGSLVSAATDIDLAVAVRGDRIDVGQWVDLAGEFGGESDDDPLFGRPSRMARAKELLSMDAASIVFRSQEKLKGGEGAEFRLYGFWRPRADPPPARTAGSPSRSFGDDTPPGELWPTAFVSMCGRSISTRAGGLYLVFRDADGRLLDVAEVAGRPARDAAWGWSFEEVSPLGDPWLEAVRRVAAPSR